MIYLLLRYFAMVLCKFLFRVRTSGREHIPRKGGVLLVSNHTSYLDPILLGVAYPRPLHFFARSELFENFWFGRLIRALHAFPVDTHRPLDKDAMERAIKRLKEGKAVVVYPEGTRSRDGLLHRGEAGAGFFAVKAGVPVLPVYLKGSYAAFPPGARMIRPKKISVHFGKALFFSPETHWRESASPQKGHRQRYYQKIADQMMEAIQKIKDLTD